MNIIFKLTKKHLLENKKRTVVTILGIAAATALITAILVGVFSFLKFFGTVNRLTDGDVHADFGGVSWHEVETLKNDERIKLAGAILTDPTITGIRVLSGKEDRFRTGNVIHGDADLSDSLLLPIMKEGFLKPRVRLPLKKLFLRITVLNLRQAIR